MFGLPNQLVSNLGRGLVFESKLYKKMKKLKLTLFSIVALGILGLFSTLESKASGTYTIRTVLCKNGGTVYRCDYGGSESCNVGGQKFCDEVVQ
jgi:hypothetical protein